MTSSKIAAIKLKLKKTISENSSHYTIMIIHKKTMNSTYLQICIHLKKTTPLSASLKLYSVHFEKCIEKQGQFLKP